MEVSGQLNALAALPAGKESLVSIAYEAGWQYVIILYSIGCKLSNVQNHNEYLYYVFS
jgi:hypothetical protein